MLRAFFLEARMRFLHEVRSLFMTRFTIIMAIGFYGIFLFYNFWYINILESDSFILTESLAIVPWILAFFIPCIVFQSWMQEKNLCAYPLFLASPLPSWMLVLIRYFVLGMFLSTLLILCWMVYISLLYYVDVDKGSLALSFFGHWMLSLLFLSLTFAICSWGKDMVFSCFMSVMILSGACLLHPSTLALFFEPWIRKMQPFFNIIAPYDHLENLTMGVLVFEDCYYFIALASGLLFFKIAHVDGHRTGRHWSK